MCLSYLKKTQRNKDRKSEGEEDREEEKKEERSHRQRIIIIIILIIKHTLLIRRYSRHYSRGVVNLQHSHPNSVNQDEVKSDEAER